MEGFALGLFKCVAVVLYRRKLRVEEVSYLVSSDSYVEVVIDGKI